jgi:methyl-accepting chemotaxis protein
MSKLTFLQSLALDHSLILGLLLLLGGVAVLVVVSLTDSDDKTFVKDLRARRYATKLFTSTTGASLSDDSSVMLRQTILTALDQLEAAAKVETELRANLEAQGKALQACKDEAAFIRESSEAARRDGLLSAARTLGVAIEGIHGSSNNLRSLSESAGNGAKDQQRLVAEAVQAMDGLDSALAQMQHSSDRAVVQAQSARDRAMGGAKVVDETVESIRQVERKAEDLAEMVRALGSQARDVERIMEVISDIADQTNLLALNAAIEAARAGDAGRGFAVVADEVRKLAEKTMNATRDVADHIKGIQNGVERTGRDMEETSERVDQAVTLAQSSGDALREIVELSGSSATHINEIADDTRRQAETGERISRIVRQVSGISEASYEGAQSASSAVDVLLERVVELESMNAVFQLIGGGSIQHILEEMATLPTVRTMRRDDQEQAMRDTLKRNPSFELLYITDARGRQTVSNIGRGPSGITADGNAVGKDWSTRAWFRQPVEMRGTIVSDVYVSSATGENCITVSTPILDPAGTITGVLAADINLGKASSGH